MNEYRVFMNNEEEFIIKSEWFYKEESIICFESSDEDGNPEMVAMVDFDRVHAVIKMYKVI